MEIKMQSKCNTNGNTYQLIANVEKKEVRVGYFLFNGVFEDHIQVDKIKEIQSALNFFLAKGYTQVK